MLDERKPNKCPDCGYALFHWTEADGSYSKCHSCGYRRTNFTWDTPFGLGVKENDTNDDWREDWLNYDDQYDDESTPWSHMFVDREPPALQFRREISPYLPLKWQKNRQLSKVAQDEIESYAKHYLDICLDIVESRQMYRALMDMGFDAFLKRYTRLSYLELVKECNDFTTRKPCEKCGHPVYFLPVNEPQYILCQNCQAAMPTLQELKTMPYSAYLMTEHWKRTRLTAIERANGRCQLCNKEGGLHVHHRTYERRGEELPEDLTVLCADCHKMFHDNWRLQS